jgi:DNA-binding NarL/FixJ family response regulator
MKQKPTLVIADDHPIFLHGLKSILETEGDVTIIGEAGNGEQALTLIRDKKPDFAILDVEMPKMTGFQVMEALQQERNETQIIFLTMYRDEALFNRALDLGVKAYVLKENAVLDILSAIDAVSEGRYFISPLISDYLIRRSALQPAPQLPKTELLNTLTTAERRILELIAQEKTNKMIAEELFLSVKTIENHRSSIVKKLGLSGSFALNKFVMTK